jgi:large subunit ribosomal protein L19
MNLLQKFEKKTIQSITEARDASKFESFNVGDTIIVGVKILDVSGFRVQKYEGICIAKSNKGSRNSFTVRRIGAGGEGIEQIFMYYLSNIDSITVTRRGDVRRAKLYYLQNLKGKAAKVKEKFFARKSGK